MALNLFHFSEDGKFFRELDNIKQIKGSPLKVILFMYDPRYDLISIFSRFKSEVSVIKEFKKVQEDNDKILYAYNVENEDIKDQISVFFIISKKEQIALLVSNQRSEEYKKCLSFFYNFYPFINRIFLRSYQILKLLTHVEEMNKIEIIARMYVAKRYFGKTIKSYLHHIKKFLASKKHQEIIYFFLIENNKSDETVRSAGFAVKFYLKTIKDGSSDVENLILRTDINEKKRNGLSVSSIKIF